MANEAEYKLTNRRPTEELVLDEASTPLTLKVSQYGWDNGASAKVRLGVDANGAVGTTKLYTFVKKYYTSAGAASDGIIWSPTAGKKWVMTDIILNVSAAATVTIEDDLAAGDSAIMKFELAANGGFCKGFQTPLQSGEADADLLITTSAGNVYVTVLGYEV